MPKRKKLEIRAADGGVPELLIYDEIGPSWYGLIGADTVMEALAEIGSVDAICVRINSPGGDVFEGVAIYNALVRNKARVTIAVDALAASIASVIAMAGDEIEIAGNAMLMVHNAWTFAMGNAVELREICDVLDQIDATITNTYVARTSQTADDVRALMAAETWLTADKAVEMGFADTKIDLKGAVEASVPAGRYRNTPRSFLQDGGNPQDAKRQLIDRFRGGAADPPPTPIVKIAAGLESDGPPPQERYACDVVSRQVQLRRRKFALQEFPDGRIVEP